MTSTSCPPSEGGWPPIEAHRLLSDGRGAALVTPAAEIDWWCGPRFDSAPRLWSLVDRAGAGARIGDARPIEHSDEPAGATTRTRIETDGTRVEVRDGLVDGRLVRLFRGIDGDLDVTHRVDLGGFDGTPRSDVVTTALRAEQDKAAAIEITGVDVRPLDPDLAAAELRAADERFLAATRARPTRSHPDRVRDAFAVMQACT
jgi:hypothetical protein